MPGGFLNQSLELVDRYPGGLDTCWREIWILPQGDKNLDLTTKSDPLREDLAPASATMSLWSKLICEKSSQDVSSDENYWKLSAFYMYAQRLVWPGSQSVTFDIVSRLGIQIRNMKMVFKIYCTWRWVMFEKLMMKIYDFFYLAKPFSHPI